MSIFNRRNAMLGWAAWVFGKRMLKHRAKAATHGNENGAKNAGT